MMIEKEIALALDFKNAPKELQDAAKKHYDNQKNLTKALKKVEEDKATAELAQKLSDESGKIYRAELKKWNPEV